MTIVLSFFTEARAAFRALVFGAIIGDAASIKLLALASRCGPEVAAAGKHRTCATWGAQGCANMRRPRYL